MGADDEQSKITGSPKSNTKTNSNKREAWADTSNSKQNSKPSEVQNQKPDYIHVRARRGQATDSHSLAERVSANEHFIFCVKVHCVSLCLDFGSWILK